MIGLRWLHVIAMAFFVGGQMFLAAAVVPVERSAPDRERLRAIARRFGYGTLVAIGVLIVTGSVMASHEDKWGDTTLQIKLGLVALVAVLVSWHMSRPELHVLEGAIFRRLAGDRVAGLSARGLRRTPAGSRGPRGRRGSR